MIKIIPPKSKFISIQDTYKKLKQNGKKKNVILIDGMNLFLAAFYSAHHTTAFGDDVGGVYSSLKTLMALVNKFQPYQVILCFDGKGGSDYRKKIYSQYKEERSGLKDVRKIGRFDRQKEAADQLKKLWLYLDNLPVKLIIANGMEADDAISYIANEGYKEYNKIIVSNDKDFYQLIRDDILVYSNTKKKMFNKDTIINEFDILPENFVLFRAIDGDKSDNIEGIKGIGIKTINKLFPELKEKQMVLNDIFSICENKTGINNKYQLILNNKDIIERNYRLMQLKEAPITTKDKLYLEEKLFDDINTYNFSMIKSFLLQDGFIAETKKGIVWNNTFSFLNSCAIKHNKKTRETLNEQRTNI